MMMRLEVNIDRDGKALTLQVAAWRLRRERGGPLDEGGALWLLDGPIEEEDLELVLYSGEPTFDRDFNALRQLARGGVTRVRWAGEDAVAYFTEAWQIPGRPFVRFTATLRPARGETR